jgi:hypothetical protein
MTTQAAKITPSYIENQILQLGDRNVSSENQEKRKLYQIVLPSMESDRKISFKNIKSGTPSVRRFFAAKKKKQYNYATAQPPASARISSPISINCFQGNNIVKSSRTSAVISPTHRPNPFKYIERQRRVNEQSITFPSSPYHDVLVKGESCLLSHNSAAGEEMDENRPISNIGSLQLPLFDKLMLYQMVKGTKVIASTSLNQLQGASLKLPNTARTTTNVKRRLNLQHVQSAENKNKDDFFMFTSTISNFKSKSQANRYYIIQKDLHNLRNMISNAKNEAEEIRMVINVRLLTSTCPLK